MSETDWFLDRDLSWLEFNQRVLHEALDERTPLLERVNFLSIFTSNLDEFVMKRVFGIREQVRAGVTGHHPAHASAREKLMEMQRVVGRQVTEQARVWREELIPRLAEEGVHILRWEQLSDTERAEAARIYHDRIFPVLTPLSVDIGHPFPFISNLSLSLGIRLRDPDTGETSFARVKVPQVLPQWVRIETPEFVGAYRLIYVADLIAQHLEPLFPGMEILQVMPFRLTRNADVESNDFDAEDLLEVIEDQIRKRRVECVVRLEHPAHPDPAMLELLRRELHLESYDLVKRPALLEYKSLREIASLRIDHLRYPTWRPLVPVALADEETRVLDVLANQDLLVHHPYESFDDTVLRMVREAVEDPEVLALKMTLYRTGSASPFIPLLRQAAEAGKQVVCLVELKARFDEEENIAIAKQMEKVGVHVVYGFEELKTHTKTTLIVRREGNAVRRYAHVGTGNYHSGTARLYVDLGLLTAREDICADVADLFNHLTGRSKPAAYRKLLIAPVTMKPRFLDMIQREITHHEAGRPARIIAKVNQLEDRDICRALYEASRKGVAMDLIVRGFNVLRPGVQGLSENIRVISIIGRFLEHSRIYYFRNGAEAEADGEFYLGSADWMHRNQERRVEAVTPIEEPRLRAELWDVLQIQLNDQRSAWDMQSDGSYVQRQPPDADAPAARGAHQLMMERTLQRHAAG